VRIAFDAHMVGARETGNESYAANLIRALATGWPDDSYQVLTPDIEKLRSAIQLPPNATPTSVWPGWSPFRITLAIPAAAWRNKSDVLHMTTYVAPPFPTRPTVVTIHDLSYLVYPRAFSRRVRTTLKTLVPMSIRNAARVIAVSEHTKQDLIRFYGIAPEKVAVTPLAPGPAFGEIPNAAEMELPAGITEPFVLAVGNLEPRKNLDRLLAAFAVLVRERGFDGQLVLVGKGPGGHEILTRARREGVESRVVLPGFVSEPTLVLLYNRAKVFVYPSLYEGFGLPPIEAMSCGCPVVASNTSVLPETLGDAAILVDPESVAGLVQAIDSVLRDEGLARTLKQKGIERAGRLDWHETAARTHAVYAEVFAEARYRKPA
jgi:glycosyltransferase involved in cell wall biosynthesis